MSRSVMQATCTIFVLFFIPKKKKKLHLFSGWIQLCGLLEQMQSQEGGRERGRKKTLRRSSFLLAAGEQIKETWRRNNFPPSFSSLALSPLLCCRQLVLSQQGKKKRIFLEVMDFSGAGIGGGDIYQLDFNLCFTSSMRFSPFSSVQTLICIGT